jgi:TonB family protein
MSRAVIAVLAAIGCGNQALAQSRCDCTRIIGNCQAEAQVQSSFIEITSNAPECARVDYVVDGTPFVALVVDGAARASSPSSQSSSVIVQSCQVCFDNSTAAAGREVGSSLIADGEVTRLIGVAPTYPPDALARGIEGYAEVRFEVDLDGMVNAPAVVASEPAGVFDEAALAAVSRWRYTHPVGEPQTKTERIDFTLDNALFSLRPAAAAQPVAASEFRPNRCIQEDTRYAFGTGVDISLVNACEVPLFVYSCAAGTGRDRDLWVCRDPEGTRVAEALSGIGRLEITRAPNGEYWWLACPIDDSACRSDGRQWVRATDRQSANVDPQGRTRARLARSF